MAYVTPQDPNAEDPNQVSLDAPVRLATQAPGAVGTGVDGSDIVMEPYASGSGTAGAAATTSAPKASSGTFTNLSSYLNANQGGAQNLGTQVGNKITEDVNKASTDLSTANDAFRNEVAANTNKATPDYIANAVAAPKDYLNDETFAKDLSGTYSGPNSFLNTKNAQSVLGSVQNAQQTAQLAGTEGGRTQLINKVSAAPLSRGGANLDQWLVQGNAPALGTVQNAAAGAEPLQTNYDTAVAEGDKAAQAATKNNQDLRAQILQGLTTGQSAYTNQLQAKATDVASKMNANNTAIANFLKTGTGDVGAILPQLGMTPQALAGLQAANDAAKAKGLPGVDLSQFWTGTQSPNFDVGNVANEGDIANLNAYAHFLGNSNPVINRGAVTPGSFDFVNAGQRIADMMKTNSATGGSNATPVANPGSVGSNTIGGYVGNANTGGSKSTGGSGSSNSDISGGGSGSSGGTYSPGYTVGDDGIAHMDSTGLTDGQAKALGVLAGLLTGIPALGTVGQYINNSINQKNFDAAQAYNNAESAAYAKDAQAALGAYGGYTTGSDMNVGSQAYTDAQRAAQNNVVKTPDQITSESSPTANYAAQAEAQAKLNAAIAAAQAQDQATQDPMGAFIAQQEAAAAQRQAEAEAQAAQQAQAQAEAAAQAQAAQQAQAQAEAQAAQQAQAAAEAQAAQQAAAEAQAAQDARGYSSNGTGYSDGSESGGGWSSSGNEGGGWGSYSGGGNYGGYTTGSNSDGGGGGDFKGGYVKGPGTGKSDSIPTTISNGEYIIPADIVEKVGREFFDRLLGGARNAKIPSK